MDNNIIYRELIYTLLMYNNENCHIKYCIVNNNPDSYERNRRQPMQ